MMGARLIRAPITGPPLTCAGPAGCRRFAAQGTDRLIPAVMLNYPADRHHGMAPSISGGGSYPRGPTSDVRCVRATPARAP